MNQVKIILAIVLGGIATFFEQYGLIISLVTIIIIMDFTTGLVKSKITGEKWNSSKGTIGFWKKVALLLAIFFGIFIDYLIPLLLESGFNFTLQFKLSFGLTIGVYIIFNESISICENLHEAGVKLPGVITKLLTSAKDALQEEEEKDE